MRKLITAKSIKQLHENSHAKAYRRREKEMFWLLTAKYIKQLNENSPAKAYI